MKSLVSVLISFTFAAIVFAQSDLQRMVDAEHQFAALAAEKGNRTAFLAFMTDDAYAFTPGRINAKTFWSGRGESKALLSWAPNFADISSDGQLGYTTGNWEWRQTKDSNASAFGEFITIWQKQKDGMFKWTLDIGIDHDKPAMYSTDWQTREDRVSTKVPPLMSTAIITDGFYSKLKQDGLGVAYDKYADDAIRSYRQNRIPSLGKAQAILLAKTELGILTMDRGRVEYVSSDLVAILCNYSRTADGKEFERGNALQVWRRVSTKWRLVLDVYLPTPQK